MKNKFKTYSNKSLLFIGICISLLFSSCHKDVTANNQVGSTYASNYRQVFEDFWNDMNKSYVFWSIDPTNWDEVHDKYAPIFDSLNVNPGKKTDSIVAHYFKEIVDGLVDSHYNLSLITGYGISPSLDRKWKDPQFIGNLFKGNINSLYPDSINYYNIKADSSYLNNKFVAYDTSMGFYCISGTVKGTKTLYFGFSTFSLATEYGTNSQVKKSMDNFLAQLANPAITGVIIDVRGNGGGEVTDLNFLIGSFISSPLKIGFTRSKNGSGRLDYTPWADAIVTPNTWGVDFTKPIIVLTDGLSASMSELTAMALKLLPNTKVVGDTTWGANGPLTQNSDYNAGSFSFGNIGTSISTGTTYYYGSVYTSSTMFKYINGNVYEGRGFPPDYVVKVGPNDINLPNKVMKDPQLEKAISLIPQ